MRVDANVSVRRSGDDALGTRCEIKNLNSLRSLGRAIEYETERQIALLEAGERVVQQTRHWDEDAGRHRRPALEGGGLRLPLLPRARPGAPGPRRRVAGRGGRHHGPAARRAPAQRLVALPRRDGATGAQLDQVADRGRPRPRRPGAWPRSAAGVPSALALARTANEAATDARAARRLDPDAFVALLTMEQEGELSATQAKAVLADMLEAGGRPGGIAAARGFEAMSEDSLAATVAEVVAAHPDEWARYREGGGDKLTGFFTGQVMKATQGQADGKAVAAELARLRGA